MVVTLVGITEVDFKNPEGVHIKGANLYVSYQAENVIGQKTDKFFVKEEIPFPDKLEIGDTISLFFNQKGKVEAISVKK